MDNNTIFFQVTVMDNQDPMMLGRIRAKLLTDDYSGVTTGSPTVTTDGSYTILKYTGTGTYNV